MKHTSFFTLRPGALAVVLSSAALLLLSGCSGEPSSADIEKALAANATQGSAAMEQFSRGSSKNFMPQVHAAKKLGCRKETDAAWQCDVELDMTPPHGVRAKVPTTMRFIAGSDGWTASR